MRTMTKRNTIFRDLLHNCSRSCITDEDQLSYAKGIYVGFISTIIGFYHPFSVKSAMEYTKYYIPADFDERCVPESWRDISNEVP